MWIFELHFLRMITAERQFLQMLQNGLLLTNGIGLIIALLAGYFISRRTLKPIRTITQAARAIEVTDLSRRIPEPPVQDELSELVLGKGSFLHRCHQFYMTFGIVFSEQAQGGIEQILHTHQPLGHGHAILGEHNVMALLFQFVVRLLA